MKKVFRVIGIIIIVIIVGVGILLAYVRFSLPHIDAAPDIKITATPAQLAHGKYLVNHVAVCVDCHSQRDFILYAAPIIAGTEGGGGELFNEKFGFPGSYISKNITPYNLKSWTDGEIFRAVTEGVDKDGNPLFPVMPYLNYGQADKRDIYDILAYVRTLNPVVKDIPASHSDFPMNFIIHTIPQKSNFRTKPAESDTVNYGKYLVTMASCYDCHTNIEKGKPIPGMDFAGGREFPMPSGGIVSSANITPDNETGIGKWSKEDFIRRFKIFTDSSYHAAKIEKGEFNTIMPWTSFCGMTQQDLGAIYAYLRTIKPIHHEVVKFKK